MLRYFKGALAAYKDHLSNGHDYMFQSMPENFDSLFGKFISKPNVNIY